MTPGQYDFAMVRGTTSPFVFRLKQDDGTGALVPMPFDEVRLAIAINPTTTLIKSTVPDGGLVVTDAGQGEITWTPTVEETRQLPLNQAVPYEIEVRKDTNQDVYLMGGITGIGGTNDD
jgi:hypothetical protein